MFRKILKFSNNQIFSPDKCAVWSLFYATYRKAKRLIIKVRVKVAGVIAED